MRCVSFSNLIIDLDRVFSAQLAGAELIFLCEGNQRLVVDNGSDQQASACWSALLAATQPVDLNATATPVATPSPRTFVCMTCRKARPLDEAEIDDPPSRCSDCALTHTIKTGRLEAERLNRVIADQAAQLAELRETRKQEVATALAQMARKDQERDDLLARGRWMLDGAQLLRSNVIGVLSALQSDDAPDVADVAAALRDMFDKWLHAANAW